MSDESVVHCIASADTLRQYIGTLTPLVDECKLHMGDEGWHVSAVEPGNVAMVNRCDLPPRAFEAYEAPGSATVGVNLTRFEELFGPAAGDDLVTVSVNMETRHLELSYEHYGSTNASMALIDPDSIRKEPDQSDLGLPNEIVIEGHQFEHATNVAEMVSDHIEINAYPDDRIVEFVAAGDTDNIDYDLDDEDLIDARVNEETSSLFSEDYMSALSDPIPDDAEVTLTFGDEFPLKTSWSALEGQLEVEQMIAPRIRSD